MKLYGNTYKYQIMSQIAVFTIDLKANKVLTLF
jgi:hypothetical protein